MFVKSSIIAAFLAAASQVLAAPTVNVVNRTPSEIEYALVGPGGVVSSGSIAAGATKNLPTGYGQGYSCKLAPQGKNPQASSGILQFEYTYSNNNNNLLFYDWSALNGNPNPFSKYARTIQPARPGNSGSCQPITCKAGQDDMSCESVSSGMGPVNSCPAFDGVVLTATIG